MGGSSKKKEKSKKKGAKGKGKGKKKKVVQEEELDSDQFRWNFEGSTLINLSRNKRKSLQSRTKWYIFFSTIFLGEKNCKILSKVLSTSLFGRYSNFFSSIISKSDFFIFYGIQSASIPFNKLLSKDFNLLKRFKSKIPFKSFLSA